MSDKINDGGPAFPRGTYGDQEGMRLRDWFAGQAPVDFDMARQAASLPSRIAPDQRMAVWESMAILRYEYADAMISASNE